MKGNSITGNQIIKGSFWIIALEFSNQALQLVKTFYAAQILSPADFGIVGFAFLIIAFIDVLSTTGMKEAIIQRTDNTETYLSTVYIIELGKGFVVLFISVIVAIFFTDFFQSSNAALTKDIIIFIGCIYLIQCSTNVGVVYFEKEMQFNKFFIYQFSGTVADVVVTLILIQYLHNVWALFYGLLSGIAVRSILSFIVIEFKPKLEFHYAKAKELLRYGKWIFKARLFTFFGMQLDSIVITTFFNLYSLGIYQMALRIGNLPMNQVANIMGKIVFPAYSKMQDNHQILKQYFITSLNVILVLLLPIVILIYVFIPEFTVLFLGTKWLEITVIVRILILSGLIRILASLVDYLFCALGEPKVSASLQFNRFACFAIFIAPMGYFFGVVGVALTGLISVTAVFIFYLWKACNKLQIGINEIFKDILQPSLFALIIVLMTLALKSSFYRSSGFIEFFIFIFATSLIYLSVGLLLTRFTHIKLFEKSLLLLKSYKSKL
jgi:lipopolysaccharide exporter